MPKALFDASAADDVATAQRLLDAGAGQAAHQEDVYHNDDDDEG
jgi:hypothetical protein